ncbi:MAG: M48 family metallopeptidase, partial [Thermoplasmata archaeon]
LSGLLEPAIPALAWLACGAGLLLSFRRSTAPVLLRLAALFAALWALLATTALVAVLSMGEGSALAAPWLIWDAPRWEYWALGGLGAGAVLLAAFALNQVVGRGLLAQLHPTTRPWPTGLAPPPARTTLGSFPSERPDAFAFTLLELPGWRSGPRRHEVILLSEGLLARLTLEETRAVVAHELGHVRDLDARYVTYFRTFARMMRWDPVLAGLAWAVTRHEEYRADLEAVRLTRDPRALARALYKVLDAASGPADRAPAPGLLGLGGRAGRREALRRIERLLELADSPEFRGDHRA